MLSQNLLELLLDISAALILDWPIRLQKARGAGAFRRTPPAPLRFQAKLWSYNQKVWK